MRSIGVIVADDIATGLVVEQRLAGQLSTRKEEMVSTPAGEIVSQICEQVQAVAEGQPVAAIGMGFPGIVHDGTIQESPNLQQLKGFHVRESVQEQLQSHGITAPVFVYNDADIVAAGLAATRGELDRQIRVWTLGNGIGFGLYPHTPGVWEGGHMTVSLDPAENYCACGGKGHLEGIMGYRAIRRRFLDMEPEEVFQHATEGDGRCCDFVKLWHRALAAASATAIHMVGPVKFLISGSHARHVDVRLLHTYLHEMVKMSPLQDYVFEVVEGGDEIAVIGAAVNAEKAAFPG